jgi:hypothetical protein
MEPEDNAVAPVPAVEPVTLIVFAVPAQSVIVRAAAPPAEALVIFSMVICAMTVELLCCLFLEFVPIAMGIKTAHPSTPTVSTRQAIMSSIKDIPR